MQDIYKVETHPLALSENMITGDKYRITFLTEGLIRLEYDEEGVFEDRPTQMVFFRDFPKTDYRVVRTEDGIEVHTKRIHLIYNEKEFTSWGLSIQVKGNLSAYHSIWHYGEEIHDLKGTARTLDMVNGATELEHGILSRFGYSLVDDSRSQVLLPDGWIEPRRKGIKDLYFFGYGHDYKEALHDFYRLCGKTPMLPRFALGNWWSRYYKYSEESYNELMDKFQEIDEHKGIIVDSLPRERTLYRKKSGTVADKQAIASYVDKAFIVQSLDDNFNVRRVERFMVQIMEENISSVLVLNKADLDFDRQSVEEQIKHISSQIPVFFTSIHQLETIVRLRKSISEGETVVFVGSSGVGKSSLVNALCEKPVLLTSDISLSTGKGRHTSTRREMVLMDSSGVLIDTPGVREFGLAIDNPDSLAEVLEISDYAELCRFKDCKHINEPGCAVLEAVNSGVLDYKVYASYLKLRREAWHFSASEHEKRKKEKSFTKLVEEVKNRKANR